MLGRGGATKKRPSPTPPPGPLPLGARVEVVSGGSNYWNRREFYESEYRIMRSLRVAMAVVRALRLNTDPGFFNAKPGAPFKPTDVEAAGRVLIGRLTVEPVK